MGMRFIVGKVLSENVKEQPPKTFGTDVVISFLHDLTVNGVVDNLGEPQTLRISKYTKNIAVIAGTGAEVKILFSSKLGNKPGHDGKPVEFHKIEEVDILTPASAAPVAVSSPVLTATATNTFLAPQGKATHKDVSIETQAVLKSLIESRVSINSQGDLDLDDLEKNVRACLGILHKVVKESQE